MKRKKMCALFAGTVMGISMFSIAAMAQETTIAIPYQQESAWDQVAMTNDDTVTTGLNIHSTPDQNSPVIGYMYQGGAAWVLEKGDAWTEIYSGGLTGFVMNDYLVYGIDVTGPAQVHGREGVATTWNDVKLYAENDPAAEVISTIDSGTAMILAEDGGNWIRVQSGADGSAYVSSDDVSRVLLLNTAVPKEGADSSGTDTDASYTDDSYTDSSYTEESYTEESYTDSSYTEESYTDSSYTDSSYTDSSYTDSSADYGSSTSAETYSESSSQSTSSLPEGIGYYDEYTGTYYDYYGNTLYTGTQQIGYYDEYTGTYYDVYGEKMFTVSVGGGSSSASSAQAASESEASVPQTEAQTQEIQTQTVSTGADDTNLLAAIIYCEAGNQSFEGMVAVGAVVLNRVASPSFPNTIHDVIYESGQFTPAYSGALASALASGVPSACYEAAVAALNGQNPVGGALYFNTGSGKGVKIGAHQFY